MKLFLKKQVMKYFRTWNFESSTANKTGDRWPGVIANIKDGILALPFYWLGLSPIYYDDFTENLVRKQMERYKEEKEKRKIRLT